MKIALFNNLYYPYNRGGAETVVEKMIADLRAQNHKVILFTLRPKDDAEINTNAGDETNGLKIYRFASDYSRLAEFTRAKKLFWHLSDTFSKRKIKAIKKILITEKPELVITHNLMGLGLRLPQTLKKMNIRHEHYLHDIQLLHPSGLMMLGKEQIIDSPSAKIYQYFTRLFFGSPEKVFSPSNWLLKEHRKRGFFKDSAGEVKRPALAEDEKAIGERKSNPRPNKNFLFVGQIEDHKGVKLLLQAFQEALKIKPEMNLTVVGDGSLLGEAKKIAGGDERIKFRGRLDGAEIKSLMAAGGYLIVPSLCYENSPTTIYEAHSVGLTVLAADIGGIPEIINADDRLFKPGDKDDLVKNILES